MKTDKSEKSILLVIEGKIHMLTIQPTRICTKLGVLANILQMLKLPDGTVKVLVEGVSRVSLKEIKDSKDYVSSEYIEFPKKKLQNMTKAKH